jgi:Protein of unknown function (DUF2752)
MIPITFATGGRVADILRAASPPAVILLFAFVLLRFPPEQYGFYPRCPLHELLHLQCPGCGATRSLAAVLRGDLVEAMRFNALTTLLLPFAFGYGILCYIDYLKRKPVRSLQLPSVATYSVIAIAVVFMVVRNLPGRTF